MSHFVLVHGAWHGGWVWRKLRPLLEASGHGVSTPTLTGLGERCHLASPETGLETHVEDITNLFEFEELTDVVLVAHSYSGIPVRIAAERLGAIRLRVVYLDAIIPRDGDSVFDLWPAVTRRLLAASRRAGTEWLLPVPDDAFGITNPTDLAWVRSHLTAQPRKTYEDRARLTMAISPAPASAIFCGTSRDADQEAAAYAAGCSHVRWIAAGHDAMVSHPNVLAEALLDLARSQ